MNPRIDESALSAVKAAGPEPDWPVVCKHLQESGERALKALHIGQRSLAVHAHGMRQAWEKPKSWEKKFQIEKNDKLLDEMTLHGGDKGCGTPSGWNPKELAEEFRPIAEALVRHAERRVPVLMAEHEQERAQRRLDEPDGTVIRPSAKAAAKQAAATRPGKVKRRGNKALKTPVGNDCRETAVRNDNLPGFPASPPPGRRTLHGVGA